MNTKIDVENIPLTETSTTMKSPIASESSKPETKTKETTTSTSSSTSNSSSTSSASSSFTLKIVAFALLVVVLVGVIIYLIHNSYKTQLNNVGALLENSRKQEAILSGRLKDAEQDKQIYIQKINQLNESLQNQYTPILPMTVNSYDAPDPDKPKEKPKLLKDKEAIKAYVNSKRQTVQDELDERETKEKEQEDAIINETENELMEQTKSERRDDKVDEIMEIISSQ